VRRLLGRCLLRPDDLQPTRPDFEVVGAFNPGAVRVSDDEVMLLARVAERPREARPGWTALPRWDTRNDGALTIDWVRDDEIEVIDPRVVRMRRDGLVRLTFTSHLRVVRLDDGGRRVAEVTATRFDPASPLEEFGVEDPRITTIDGIHYFTYVAVSRHGAATALGSTRDFHSFERHGVIFCPENKDVLLFPERIGGRYAALHRPNAATPFCRPEIWYATSDDLTRWGSHDVLHGGGSDWESGRVGGGVPPVRVPGGWLEIYHGNRHPTEPLAVGAYSAGALLLDAEGPARILARTREPLLVPEADFEREGFVPDVLFPTGIVETGETFLIYSGAADAHVGLVEVDRDEVLSALEPLSINPH
jgi:predicted GH43/DUF377 family glycosyl hydrolase